MATQVQEAPAQTNLNRDELVKAYLPLVRRIASRMSHYSSADMGFEDLVSCGTLGLIQAADRFSPDTGVGFSAFASPRIRGAILDALRTNDHLPRSVRRSLRATRIAEEGLAQRLGRTPSDGELAAEANLEPAQVRTLATMESRPPTSLDALISVGSDGEQVSVAEAVADPFALDFVQNLEHQELVAELAEAIQSLAERERLVITLRYYEALTVREIAAMLNVSETRVSQICARAVRRLRAYLEPQAAVA